MKTSIRIIIAALLPLAAGCTNIFQAPRPPAESGGQTGLVRIKAGGERTLRPESFSLAEYVFTFTAPEHDPVSRASASPSLTLELAAGTWTLTVTGFTGSRAERREIAKGAATVEVIAGRENTVSVQMNLETAEGEGTFSYAISFPVGISRGTAALAPLSGGTVRHINLLAEAADAGGTLRASGSLTVDSGYYSFTVDLLSGTGSAGTNETAHIYRGLETRAEYAFTAADFIPTSVYTTSDANTLLAVLNTIKTQAAGNYTVILGRDEPAFAPYDCTQVDFSGKTITIRGEGHSVTLNGNGSLLTLREGLSLALRDISLQGRGLEVQNNAALLTVQGAALLLGNGALVTLNKHSAASGEIKGGGVYVGGGSLTVDGGSVDGNKVVREGAQSPYWVYPRGGGVYVDNGSSLLINSGSVNGNGAFDDNGNRVDGGGVFAAAGASLVMNGGQVANNTVRMENGGDYSWAYGGGIASYGDFTLNGGDISGNVCQGSEGLRIYLANGGISSENGRLTINGGRVSNNTGGITAGGSYEEGVYVPVPVTMNDGLVSGNTEYGIVASGFILNGGTISGNANAGVRSSQASINGGSIINNNGNGLVGDNLVMSGGLINGNASNGVNVYSGAFAMSGGEISGNGGRGVSIGSMYAWVGTSTGTFIMDGGRISGNTGEGVWIAPPTSQGRRSAFTMNNGEIINSVNCGGDFTLNSGEIQSLALTTGGSGVMNGGIIRNSAGLEFGVELQVKTAFTLHNGEISGHRNVGIILRTDTSLVMDGGVIRRNGQGVNVGASGTFTLSGGEITNNDNTLFGGAPGEGGGVYISGNFTMSGGTISNNTADRGGGIFLASYGALPGSCVISGGLISGNRAVWGGGIWVANSASCTISGGTITGNTAPFGSGTCGPITLSGSPNIDPSNSIFLDYQGRTSMGSAMHYITIAGDISGSGTIAALDLTGHVSWWYKDAIIRHGAEYSGSLYNTRFSLGNWIHPEYVSYENRYNYTKTPIQGTIMADGRGSWCASADISAFSINGVPASILGTAIRINLPFGTNASSLAPLVTHTPGFTLNPASGTAQDFSSPVAYTLASDSGTVKTYTVTVFVPGQLPQGIVVIDNFNAESNDIVPALNGSTVSLTDGGFTRFQWYVDNAPRGTGNSIDLLGYPPGSHTVSLIAWKNGVPYSAETTFTVQ